MGFRSDKIDDWLQYQRSLSTLQIDLGLQRIRPVAQRLRLSANAQPLITVAGTNGKGSTVAFIEALMHSHGRTSASYTSPWLLSVNESLRFDGRAQSDEVLIAAFERVEAARDEVALTEFEFRTLAAAQFAFSSKADLVVFEVGLGGRLDAVNLFDATVAVITTIGLDHQQWLGDSLAQIAREKAGVARAGATMISADVASNTLLQPLAKEVGARAVLAQTHYQFGSNPDGQTWWYRSDGFAAAALALPALPGEHQLANAAAAISAVVHAMPGLLSENGVCTAMRDVRLAGRVQHLGDAPPRYVDVAHNPQAAGAVARWAHSRGSGALVACCAMYADKDLPGTVSEMQAVVSAWHVAALAPPRGASGEQLAAAIRSVSPGAPISVHDSVERGWRAACEHGRVAGGTVLGFGSFETVSAILRLESTMNGLDTSS